MNFEEEVRKHHEMVKKMIDGRGQVIFTTAFGSQNYGIDTGESDVDTVTFVFPSYDALVMNTDAMRFEHEVDNGKCVVCDIREGLRLLRKPSPNSIEWFLSPYIIIEPQYEAIVRNYLDNNKRMYYMTHCDVHNFLMACYGCSRGLHSRNMPAYKKFGHALRMQEMQQRYITDRYNPFKYLRLRPGDRDMIRDLKRGIRLPYQTDEYFEEEIQAISEWCHERAETFDYKAEGIQAMEKLGKAYVDEFQYKLFDIYFKEIVNERAANYT